MSRKLARPFFATPPTHYDSRYMSELVRAFSVYLQQVQNPGDIRGTTLFLSELPTEGYRLADGSVYEADGVLTLKQTSEYGVYATGRVGSVSITTTGTEVVTVHV